MWQHGPNSIQNTSAAIHVLFAAATTGEVLVLLHFSRKTHRPSHKFCQNNDITERKRERERKKKGREGRERKGKKEGKKERGNGYFDFFLLLDINDVNFNNNLD